jgi:hypothetical protein
MVLKQYKHEFAPQVMLTYYHENWQWDKQMGIECLTYFKLFLEYTQFENIAFSYLTYVCTLISF